MIPLCAGLKIIEFEETGGRTPVQEQGTWEVVNRSGCRVLATHILHMDDGDGTCMRSINSMQLNCAPKDG